RASAPEPLAVFGAIRSLPTVVDVMADGTPPARQGVVAMDAMHLPRSECRVPITSAYTFPYQLALLVLIAALRVDAQSISGDLVVHVIDPSDLTVPGATLVLTEVDTGIAHDAVTGGEGTYLFGQLKPGMYQLEVSSQGFKTTTVRDIRIQVG